MSHLELVCTLRINERRTVASNLRRKLKDSWSNCINLLDTLLVR